MRRPDADLVNPSTASGGRFPFWGQSSRSGLKEWSVLLRDYPQAGILTSYYWERRMETTVTSKGQVTIPKSVRQRLGLRRGSKVEFVVVDDRVELRVHSTPMEVPTSGFGMLRSMRAAVPADFDPADLLAP